jgi:hypothetical protein
VEQSIEAPSKLKEVLDLLQSECVTVRKIREMLWANIGSKYGSREAFEEFWTSQKIGLMLKRLGFKKRRAGKLGEVVWLKCYDKDCTNFGSS